MELKKGDWSKLREVRRKEGNWRTSLRAHALILKNKNYAHAEIADILDITARTVSNIIDNYRMGGFKRALYDDPRPGTPI